MDHTAGSIAAEDDAMSTGAMSPDAAMGLVTFEAENGIQELTSSDELYRYDEAKQKEFDALVEAETHPGLFFKGKAPKDEHYFKEVKMSALALLKLTMHARSGGRIEVMGLLQGKVDGNTFIVMDACPLPVEGTETRVNAAEQAYAYSAEYLELMKKVGRLENVIGWYHSHPGYGTWLSGIDVMTQRTNQMWQDPYLAVVVDPVRTCTAGKVEIGAFRCYSKDYKPPGSRESEYQTIPQDKIEDFGVHYNAYYQLNISYFKSVLDKRLLELLWNKYWVNTLSSSPLLTNSAFITGQLTDVGRKLEEADRQLGMHGRSSGYYMPDKKQEESQLSKCARDSEKAATEVVAGMAAQLVKNYLFDGAARPGQ